MAYERVLVATDLSEHATAAARAARALAAPHAAFLVVHVVPGPPLPVDLPRSEMEMLERYAQERDESLRADLEAWAEKAGLGRADVAIARGSVGREVAAQAEGFSADLVACGSRGLTRVERLLLGSSARAILRHARSCDVLVARPMPHGTVRRVCVATDFQAPARAAAARARDAARRHEAQLLAFHALDTSIWSASLYPAPSDTEETMTEDAAWLHRTMKAALHDYNRELLDGTAIEVLLAGRPAVEIPAFAREHGVDLLVIGTHGGGAVERMLLGSVAEAVVERSPCSVLVARAA